jgi:ADP-ribose pyrophosphatase
VTALPEPVLLRGGEFLNFFDVRTDPAHPGRHWEYVRRPHGRTGVTLVPVTADGRIILIDQFRWPLRDYVLELPSGLVEVDELGNTRAAAGRELAEETGVEFGSLRLLARGPLLPGVTDEINEFFHADVRRHGPFAADGLRLDVSTGNHGEGERIRAVYALPLGQAADWLDSRRRGGAIVDLRIYVGLFFAERRPASAG